MSLNRTDASALRKPVATPRLSHLCERPEPDADRGIADLCALAFIGMVSVSIAGAAILVGMWVYDALQLTWETF